MMSIILKEVDLPKEYTQVIAITPNGEVWQVNPIGKNERLEAQAIQIPKGHGRLIDADALETVFKDMAKCEWNQRVSPISWAYAFESAIDEIADAPTILEAEEE